MRQLSHLSTESGTNAHQTSNGLILVQLSLFGDHNLDTAKEDRSYSNNNKGIRTMDNQTGLSELEVKTFRVSYKKGIEALEKKLRRWLEQNQEIEVISTDFAAFGDKIGYVLLYKKLSSSAVSDYTQSLDEFSETKEETNTEQISKTQDPESIEEEVEPETNTASEKGFNVGALFGD
jgi:hypothetical protein